VEEIEIILNFTDITMSETDGVFEDVKKLMVLEFPHNDKWVIKTSLTIDSRMGIGEMKLDLYGDGRIYILEFYPSIGDVYYNPDIPALSQWAQGNGWKIPQPHEDLVKEDKDFWKHFYDTWVIDSDYIENLCGKRSYTEIRENKKNNF